MMISILELLSQPEIFEKKEPGIIGRLEYDWYKGGYLPVHTDRFLSNQFTEEAERIIAQSRGKEQDEYESESH